MSDALDRTRKREAHSLLANWIERNGGSTRRLVPAEEEGTAGTGLALAPHLPPPRRDEELLFVPEACFLTPWHGLRTPWGRAVLDAEGGAVGRLDDAGRAFLAVALVHARAGALRAGGGVDAGDDGRVREMWRAYAADAMPGPEECRRAFPELWPDGALELLGPGSALARAARRRRAAGAEELALIRECLAAAAEARAEADAGAGEDPGAPPGPSPDPLDVDAYQWARCMVSSRAFSNPMAFGRTGSTIRWKSVAEPRNESAIAAGRCDAFGSFMVPFADLANHCFDDSVQMNWDFCEFRRGFVFEARRDIDGGTSCCISYGKKPLQDLLLNYGFCPSLEQLDQDRMPGQVAFQTDFHLGSSSGAEAKSTWVSAGLGPASSAGTDALLHSFGSVSQASYGSVVHDLGPERIILESVEQCVCSKLKQLRATTEVLLSINEDGGYCPSSLESIKTIVYGEAAVTEAILAFVRAAQSLLWGSPKDLDMTRNANGHGRSFLRGHIHEELQRYARSIQRRLDSEDLEPTFTESENREVLRRLYLFLGPKRCDGGLPALFDEL